MGFFDRLFGKKQKSSPAPEAEEEALLGDDDEVAADEEHQDEFTSTASLPIEGPPMFVRAAEMQRAYWTHNRGEQIDLELRGPEQLDERERLRLHHLICMQRLIKGPGMAAAREKCRRSTRTLIGADSPRWFPTAMIWNSQSPEPELATTPDRQGELVNLSLTHIACLEVYRLDDTFAPTQIDFVSFDELSGVKIAAPGLIRPAKLFYHNGRDELVLVPMLYGLTWIIGEEHDRSGDMTRFVAHLEDNESQLPGIPGISGISGIGIGQQDLAIRVPDQGMTLFGLASVAEIVFPLDVRDPKFDAKARMRGLDPEEARRKLAGP